MDSRAAAVYFLWGKVVRNSLSGRKVSVFYFVTRFPITPTTSFGGENATAVSVFGTVRRGEGFEEFSLVFLHADFDGSLTQQHYSLVISAFPLAQQFICIAYFSSFGPIL